MDLFLKYVSRAASPDTFLPENTDSPTYIESEYCLVHEDALAPKPKSLSFAQAACVGVPFTTAALTLRRANTSSSDTVLVLGAAGSVGSAVVQ